MTSQSAHRAAAAPAGDSPVSSRPQPGRQPATTLDAQDRFTLCCWDCGESLSWADAVRVKTVPSVPEHVSAGTTLVCQGCADKREAA